MPTADEFLNSSKKMSADDFLSGSKTDFGDVDYARSNTGGLPAQEPSYPIAAPEIAGPPAPGRNAQLGGAYRQIGNFIGSSGDNPGLSESFKRVAGGALNTASLEFADPYGGDSTMVDGRMQPRRESLGYKVGQGLGYIAPYEAAAGAIRPAVNLAVKGARALGIPLAASAVETAGVGAVGAGAFEGAKAIRGEEADWSNVPKEAAIFGGLDVGMKAAGKLARGLRRTRPVPVVEPTARPVLLEPERATEQQVGHTRVQEPPTKRSQSPLRRKPSTGVDALLSIDEAKETIREAKTIHDAWLARPNDPAASRWRGGLKFHEGLSRQKDIVLNALEVGTNKREAAQLLNRWIGRHEQWIKRVREDPNWEKAAGDESHHLKYINAYKRALNELSMPQVSTKSTSLPMRSTETPAQELPAAMPKQVPVSPEATPPAIPEVTAPTVPKTGTPVKEVAPVAETPGQGKVKFPLNEGNRAKLESIKRDLQDTGFNQATRQPIFRERSRGVAGESKGDPLGDIVTFGRPRSLMPDWWKDKGYPFGEMRKVVDKILAGEPITQRQAKIFKSLYKDAVGGSRDELRELGERTVALDLKVGDELKIGGEWHRVTEHTDGELTIRDGRTFTVDDTFDNVPVDFDVTGKPFVRRGVPIAKTKVPELGDMVSIEKTAAGDQFSFAPQRQVPVGKIRETGKRKQEVQTQGDLMRPGKIAPGNLPQDQAKLDLGDPTKLDKGASTTLGFMGANPDAIKGLGENLAKGGTEAKAATKELTAWMKQAKNRIDHPEWTNLVNEITRADELWHRRAGQALNELSKTPLHISGIKGRLSQIRGKSMKGEAIADALERNDPSVAGIRKVLDNLFYKAKAKGIDIGHVDKYLPRVTKKDIAVEARDKLTPLIKRMQKEKYTEEALKNEVKAIGGNTAKIIDAIISEKHAETYKDAIERFAVKVNNEIFGDLSFLKSRTKDVPLPEWAYERDARKIIPWYVNAMTKRIAEVEVWGKDFATAEKRLAAISEQSTKDGALARKILDIWSGAFEKEKGLTGYTRKLADLAVGGEFTTKIGLGTATVPNITQTLISTLPKLGVKATGKGFGKLLTSKGRELVAKSGVFNQDFMHAVQGREISGPMGAVSRTVSKLSGFTGINRFNAALAASSMDQALKVWYKAAKAGNKVAQSKLTKFGVDWNKPLTENTRLEKMYRFSTDSQLQRNILNDPVMANDPRIRPLFLFKRFGGRQAVAVKDMIKEEIVTHKNPLGAVRMAATMLAGGVLGGEFVIWAKNGILSAVSGEERYRKEELLSLDRVLNDIIAVGSFGVVSDMMRLDDRKKTTTGQVLGGLADKAKFAVTPVLVDDASRVLESYTKFMADWDKYDDFGVAKNRAIPGVIAFGGPLLKAASARFMTKSQKANRLKDTRGDERTNILDLILAGKDKEAERMMKLWNEHHPEAKFGYDDINFDELVKRAKSQSRMKAEASK